MLIKNLSGIFTGSGFRKKQGRRPDFSDCDFRAGPVDISVDDLSGKILALHKSSGAHDARERIFDGAGLIATAGFVDSHTHALYSGDRSHEYFSRWQGKSYQEISKSGGGIHNSVQSTRESLESSPLKLQEKLQSRLQKMLFSGSTHVEIKTGYSKNSADELKALRFLKNFANHFGKSLPKISVTFLGLHALPSGLNESEYIKDMSSILKIVRDEQLASFVDAWPEKGFFSLEACLSFAREAEKFGLKAKIHADEISDMKAAFSFSEANAVSVDHLQQISSAGIQSLAQSKTVATLLPATSFFLNIPYAKARQLWDAGVQVALASDFNPGTAPEPCLRLSQRLAASQMKMTAAEIFCASTYNGAAALRSESHSGSLEVGLEAQILLWPLESKEPQSMLEEILISSALPKAILKDSELLFNRNA